MIEFISIMIFFFYVQGMKVDFYRGCG